MRTRLRNGTSVKKVCLSFDNGPHPEVTPHVLRILKEHHVRSNFFVIGKNLEDKRCLEILKQAHDDGHRIGNHTYYHETPLGLQKNDESLQWEINETQRKIGQYTCPEKYFRPFGSGGGGILSDKLLSTKALQILIEGKFSVVTWNCVPRDWENEDGWVDVALEKIEALNTPLVVLHDFLPKAMQHLENFLNRLNELPVQLVQDFPSECLLMDKGVRKLKLDLITNPN